jgi:hypothetical protein
MPNADVNYGFGAPRVSGAAPDGEWAVKIDLPRYAAPGSWVLDNLHLEDDAGNKTHYWDRGDLETVGFTVGFSVTGVGDTTPPQILGLSFKPTILHAAKGDSAISFEVHLADDLSGIRLDNWGLELSFQSLANPSYSENVVSPGLQIAGNDLDGVLWLGTVLPPTAPLGTYVVTSIHAWDRAFNDTELSGSALEAKGWDLSFENLP